MKAKRIVFKVGTSSLTNADGSPCHAKVVITGEYLSLHEAGHDNLGLIRKLLRQAFLLGFKKTDQRSR